MRVSDSMLPPPRPPIDHGPADDVEVQTPVEVEKVVALAQMLEHSMKAMNRNLDTMFKCRIDTSKWVDRVQDSSVAQVAIAELVELVQAKRTRSQMWVQQLSQSSAVITHCRDGLPAEKRPLADVMEPAILSDLREKHSPPPEIAEEFDLKINSGNDFFDKLLELIDLIKNGYLAGYEHIIAAYSEFFAEFNEKITAKMKDWIESENDGKWVKFNVGALKNELMGLIAKYSSVPLYPPPGKEGVSREDADNWRKALGLPEHCLQDNGDGTYSVVMDLSPLHSMAESLPSEGTVTWDTAKFQAWQTGFNAQEERMKNMLQSFTQKYSNANSYHDNFNKTLSSHLSQYADMLKAMLNF